MATCLSMSTLHAMFVGWEMTRSSRNALYLELSWASGGRHLTPGQHSTSWRNTPRVGATLHELARPKAPVTVFGQDRLCKADGTPNFAQLQCLDFQLRGSSRPWFRAKDRKSPSALVDKWAGWFQDMPWEILQSTSTKLSETLAGGRPTVHRWIRFPLSKWHVVGSFGFPDECIKQDWLKSDLCLAGSLSLHLNLLNPKAKSGPSQALLQVPTRASKTHCIYLYPAWMPQKSCECLSSSFAGPGKQSKRSWKAKGGGLIALGRVALLEVVCSSYTMYFKV